jgi:hypothetical protein
MIRSFARRAIAGAALLAAAGAQAGPVTVQFNSSPVWTFSTGNSVKSYFPTNQYYGGQAGGFSGTVNGVPVLMYCVELTQQFSPGSTYTFNDLEGSTYFTAADNKADKLGRLLSYVFNNNLITTSAASTSLQLAIWNVVYDTDYNVGTGAYWDTSGYAANATTWLGASTSYANSYNESVFKSGTNQDQLHWNKVPEPASLMLALVALGIVGLATRRRKTTASTGSSNPTNQCVKARPDPHERDPHERSPAIGARNYARFRSAEFDAIYEQLHVLPDGPEREALFLQAKGIQVAIVPAKTNVHRIVNDMAQPWLIGYRRPLFRYEFWHFVDIDESLMRKSR